MPPILNRRLLVTVLVLWYAAGVTYATLRLTYGERPAYLKIRWTASIGDLERGRLERLHSLTPRETRGERTWSYLLTDVSRDNIRAIVRDPAVEDTHEIDRGTFRPMAGVERPAYAGPGPAWVGSLLEWLARGFASLGALALGVLVLSGVGRPVFLQRLLASLAALLTSPHVVIAAVLQPLLRAVAARVPEAAAEAVAVFRVIFGAACLWYFGSGIGSPPIRSWIIFWAVLFIAGVWARFSYAMLTAGAIAWAALYASSVGTHPVAAPLMAMVCLMWSRWGDAWCVDAWWRRRRLDAPTAPPVPGQVYGYTMWVPSVVMAVSFAAAAVAKLRESGVAWITNGTVKYHFLSDADQAPVDWGLRLAQHESVAVILSLAVIVLEAVLIVGVFSKRYRYRAAAGAGGLVLLLGFALFQGVMWGMWWVMLLSFLPWHRMRPLMMWSPEPATALPDRRLQLAQAGIVLLVITQQIAVSAAKVEHAPLLSTWDMYATTYAGPQDYESKSGLTYVLVARFDNGARRACGVKAGEASELVKAGITPSSKQVLSKCFPAASAVHSVLVEGRRRPVDWTRWAFGEEQIVSVSPPIAVGTAR